MRHVGLLPLNTHTKAIAGNQKNKMLGRPLYCWVLAEAIFSKLDTIVVATNDETVISFIEKQYNWTNKIQTISRSKASENGSLNEVAAEFIENTNDHFDTLSILLPTQAFTTAKTINQCLEALVDGNDSAITTVQSTARIWNADNEIQLNTQDTQIENKAVYATTLQSFKNSNSITGGSLATVEMPSDSALTLNNQNEWQTVEQRLAQRLISQKENKTIKYLVLDVDGVFTDGGVYYDQHGELTKRFDMRDGMGLEIMRELGVDVIIMTSEDSALVRKRMEKLKIKHLFLGAKDKYTLLENFIREHDSTRAEFAYVGDDVNDLANLCSVGWSFAPNNATEAVLPLVDVVLSRNSGDGAIREATKFIIKYNKRHF